MNPAWPRSNRQCRKDVPDQGNPYNLPQFGQTPHHIFKARRKSSFLHKICPWDYSRLDQPREERKTRKDQSIFSAWTSALCILWSSWMESWMESPYALIPKYIPGGWATLSALGKKRMLFSQQTNHPQIVQATVTK